MRDNKIDQLFKETLGGLETIPSSDAWSQIEAGLRRDKKVVVFFWSRVAATIIILMSAGYWVFYSQEDRPTAEKVETISENTLIITPDQKVFEKENLRVNDNKMQTEEMLSEPNSVSKLNRVSQASIESVQSIQEKEDTEQPLMLNELIDNSELIVKADEAELGTKKVLEEQKEEQDNWSITITYSASNKQGPQTQMVTKEQPEEKIKTNIFKRAFVKASKIQKEDLSMAALRDSKDQLLAFGKKDKDLN